MGNYFRLSTPVYPFIFLSLSLSINIYYIFVIYIQILKFREVNMIFPECSVHHIYHKLSKGLMKLHTLVVDRRCWMFITGKSEYAGRILYVQEVMSNFYAKLTVGQDILNILYIKFEWIIFNLSLYHIWEHFQE